MNNLFVDYYEQEKEKVKKYIVKIDWKTIYEGDPLTEERIKQKVLASDIYKLSVKTEKPLTKK